MRCLIPVVVLLLVQPFAASAASPASLQGASTPADVALCVPVEAGAPPRVSETTLAGVPAVVRVPGRVAAAPIVLWHGLGPPDSPEALMELLPLDDVPAVKVYLGLPMLGDRAPEDPGLLVRRQDEDLATGVFEPVVMGAARELGGVVDALHAAGCRGPGGAVGLFGFSAGGAAALFAMAEREVDIDRAVLLNTSSGLSASVAAFERVTGKAYAWTDASRDLARRSDASARAGDIMRGPRPPRVLILHGTEDTMLAEADVRALQAALANAAVDANPAAAPRLHMIEGMGHKPARPEDIARLRALAGRWFAGGTLVPEP